jgi:SDR family mycofactocin-dependent oxidoreductase
MGQFDGRVVLITGGARGQGRSHALAFAREGADVAFCDIATQLDTVPYPMSTPDDLEETVALVKAEGRRCFEARADVRSLTEIQGFAEQVVGEFGRIDFLLANAGIFSIGRIAEMNTATWVEMIEVNLTGVFTAMRAVLPTMLEQGHGRIVATSSMAGKKGTPNIGHYCAAKWGVIGLVKSLAQEVGAQGITVNAVCPASVDTAMLQNEAMWKLFLPGSENPEQHGAAAVQATLNPVGVPWVKPSDISHAMVFLCSDESRYITGETIAVAAGANAGNAA